MEKTVFLSAVNHGTFFERLCHLYMKTGDYIDMENLENRKLKACKVFLSDIKNQKALLLESQLWKEYLSEVVCTVVEQPPLNASKISVMLTTADTAPSLELLPIRLTESEAEGKDAYRQTVGIFNRYVQSLKERNLSMARHCVRTWIYVSDIDNNYAAVVKARNDVFKEQGLTAETRFITSTGIEGRTAEKGVKVAIDFLTYPDVKDSDKTYLSAPEHLGDAHSYGVAFERGVRLKRPEGDILLISGTASIDSKGDVLYPGDVKKQTGRLLENIGALLRSGGATMNDVRHFKIYLRDSSDYEEVDRIMSILFPYTPRIILLAPVCRPEWLIEMECVAMVNEPDR